MDVETPNSRKSKRKAWYDAMRLRTLPLALSSTLTGAFLAMPYTAIDKGILFFTLLTTVLLQVNSNLANDYGDFSHGTDNEDRIGPQRALQSGALHAREMKAAIFIFSMLSLLSGIVLLYLAPLDRSVKLVLLGLGVAAIYASIKYTAGSNPYGYRGLGDVSVMAFFGILGVLGAYLCQTGSLEISMLLPALSIGAFSTGVLNVNNTRDIESDQKAGKITLAVKLGAVGARKYHAVLLVSGMVFMVGYAVLKIPFGMGWLFLASYPLFIFNVYKVMSTPEAGKLDPMLKQLAMSTFFLSLLLGIGLAV